jgi:hypothetical protein
VGRAERERQRTVEDLGEFISGSNCEEKSENMCGIRRGRLACLGQNNRQAWLVVVTMSTSRNVTC